MSPRLPPYRGSWPDQQEHAEECVRRLVEESQYNARFNSPQALAVLRVLVDELAILREQVGSLQHHIEELEAKLEAR